MRISDSKYSLAVVWLAIAASSIVFIEPALTDIVSILALGLFFVLGMRIPPGFGPAGFFLGLYLVANVLASAFSPDPTESFRSVGVRFFVASSCLLFVCLIYENPKRVTAVLWNAYVVAGLIAIVAGIAGYYGWSAASSQFVEFGRARAMFKDPNVYGPFIVPVALYALARLETANKRQLIGYSALLGMSCFGLLLGFSRGSWINFVIAVALFFMIRIRTQRSPEKRQRIVGTLLLLVIGGSVFIASVASTDRIQNMLDQRMKIVQYYDTGERGRLTRQLEVVKAITVTPLGVGAGQSEKDYFFQGAPHNVYLHVLIESGWIGGFSFIAFILLTLWKGARFFQYAPDVEAVHIAAYTCIVGVLVQSFFIDSTHWRHLFLLFAMVWGPLLAWESQTNLLREKWRAQRRQVIVGQAYQRGQGRTGHSASWPKKGSLQS
jgi:O-antigen ligase